MNITMEQQKELDSFLGVYNLMDETKIKESLDIDHANLDCIGQTKHKSLSSHYNITSATEKLALESTVATHALVVMTVLRYLPMLAKHINLDL